MMKTNKPRSRPRVYVFLFFSVICVASLMQAGTRISSSHSVNQSVQGAPDGSHVGKSELKRFYEKDGAARSREDQFRGRATGNSYQSDSSSLRDLEQLLLQAHTQGSPAKIAPQVLADTVAGKSTSIVIFLADQADVSAAYAMKDQDARGWVVYNTLTQHAARTQGSLQAFLKAQGVEYQSFWAANMLVATVDRALVELVANRADVAHIDSNKPARWIEDPVIQKLSLAPSAINTAEWGVLNVNAPAVWALGFTGQGMVVGDLDTGTRWTHNALKAKYRGWG